MSADWDTKAVKATPLSADEVLIIDTADSRNQKRATLTSLPSGAGEANTSSNVGAGEGLALAKVVVDLPFKSLIGETNRIVLTGNANDVTFTLGSEVVLNNQANTFTSASLQTFTHAVGGAGIALAAVAGDVSTPANGEFWYNATSNKFRARENGSTVDMIGGGGSQTPWTSDIDADGFDLTDLSNIEFRDTTTGAPAGTVEYIDVQAGGMTYNTAAGNLHNWRINGSLVGQFSATELILQGNLNLNNANSILLQNGQRIEWAGTTNREILNDTGGFLFRVETGDSFDLQINAVSEYEFDATQADFNGNNIVGVLGLTLTANINMSDNTDIQWSGSADRKIKNTTGGFEFEVETGDTFQFTVQDVNELTISASTVDVTGSKIANINPTTITDFTTVTAATGDFVWIIDATDGLNKKVDAVDFLGGTSPPFADTNSIVEGSADATKELRFEVDGNTTAVIGVVATAFTTAKTVTLPDATDTLVGKATTDVFTNKSYDLGGAGNVLTGTTAQFNTALSDNDFATLAGAESITNKTFNNTNEFEDNGLVLQNPANTFNVIFQTSAEVTSNRTLTIPLLGGNRTMVVTGLSSQITIGTEVTGASTALTDTADIAYLNQANTFGAFLTTFAGSTLRIPVSATPTIAVNGDIGIDTTITDFTTPLIRYFGTESMAVVAIPNAELTTPPDGGAVTYNATNDEFELVVPAGSGDMVLADVQTSTGKKTFAADATLAGFNLNNQVPSAPVAGDIWRATDNITYRNNAGSADIIISTDTNTLTLLNKTLTTPTIGDFQNATHDHQAAAGGGTLLSTAALSDTDDIAYLNTANTFGAFLQDFAAALMRIPVSATPTMAVDGDFAIDTLVTDWSHGILKYFDGEELGAVVMPIAQFTTPAAGAVPTYNDTNDEFEMVVPSGSGDMVLADVQTVTGAKTFLDGTFLLRNVANTFSVEFNNTVTAARVYELPDAAGTMVITGLANQLTNTELTSGVFGKITGVGAQSQALNMNGNDVQMGAGEITVTSGAVGDILKHDATGFTRFPRGTGLQVLRVNAGGTDLEYATLSGGSQTPWVSDIDADGFDLNDLSNILFRTTTAAPGATDRSIHYDDATGMEFNALTGDVFLFQINNVTELSLSATALDLNGNNLDAAADITLTGTLNLSNNQQIQWAGNADRRIFNSTGGMVFEVEATDIFDFQIAGATELTLNSTALTLAIGNDLVISNTGNLQLGSSLETIGIEAFDMIFDVTVGDTFNFDIATVNEYTFSATELDLQFNKLTDIGTTTITDLATVTGASGDFVWIIDATDGLSKKVDVLDFLGAGSQTPWASDIDAADFSLNNLDKLEFNNNADTPVITQAEIYWNSVTTGINMNVPTGDEFTWRINGAIEATLNVTELDLLSLNVRNVGFFESNATNPADGGTIRLGNDQAIAWRNAANDGNTVFSVSTTDDFTLQNAADKQAVDLNFISTATGATGTIMNQVFSAHNSIEAATTFAQITVFANVITDNSEEGELNIALRETGNVLASYLNFNQAGLHIIEFTRPLTSSTSDPSSVGQLRLANTEVIGWRNNAASADHTIVLNASDVFTFDSTLNVSTGTVQEAGVDISPIGVHDVSFSAGNFIARATLGPATTGLQTRELPTNDVNISYWEMTNAGGIQGIQAQQMLPRNFDNANIDAFVYWTAPSGTGDVAFKLKLLFRSEGDPLDAAFGTETEIVDTLTTANDQHVSPSGTLTVTGSADNDMIFVEVVRDPADAQDTFTGDVQIMGVKLAITTDAAVSA